VCPHISFFFSRISTFLFLVSIHLIYKSIDRDSKFVCPHISYIFFPVYPHFFFRISKSCIHIFICIYIFIYIHTSLYLISMCLSMTPKYLKSIYPGSESIYLHIYKHLYMFICYIYVLHITLYLLHMFICYIYVPDIICYIYVLHMPLYLLHMFICLSMCFICLSTCFIY
jgi:hypothetical protein